MFPTVGRNVHYTNLGDKDGKYPPETQAAIITSTKDNEEVGMAFHGHKHECNEHCIRVSLVIFYRTGFFFMDDVPFSKDPGKRGHWCWPPREA